MQYDCSTIEWAEDFRIIFKVYRSVSPYFRLSSVAYAEYRESSEKYWRMNVISRIGRGSPMWMLSQSLGLRLGPSSNSRKRSWNKVGSVVASKQTRTSQGTTEEFAKMSFSMSCYGRDYKIATFTTTCRCPTTSRSTYALFVT
jgi:hypothetical protein